MPREKPLDLSLLFKYKTSIKNPGQEDEAIQNLYRQYEQLHHLIGNPKRETLENEFKAFITQNHKKISRKYQSHSIEFSFKKDNKDVKVIAVPKR